MWDSQRDEHFNDILRGGITYGKISTEPQRDNDRQRTGGAPSKAVSHHKAL